MEQFLRVIETRRRSVIVPLQIFFKFMRPSRRFLSSVVLLTILGGTLLHGYAQDSLVDEIKKKQEAVQSSLDKKTNETQSALDAQKQQLSSKQETLAQVEQQISNYEGQIEQLRGEIRTLSNQLALIDDAITITQLKIRAVLIQIEEKEQDIVANTQNVDIAETAVANQKDVLRQFISLLYKQDVLYFSREDTLSNDPTLYVDGSNITTVLARKRYLETLRDTGTSMLKDFQDIGLLLDVQKTQLSNDQKRLVTLKEQLGQEEQNLAEQKDSKSQLLSQTQGKEANFSTLLDQSKQEQVQIETEVSDMQKNISDIESKIRAYQTTNLGSSELSADEIKKRQQILEGLGTTASGKVGLDWPVEPKKGLSAYFRDPTYQSVFGVAHNAIDIPTPQSTPIHAPADGYVTKVKDAGMGYSYIIVAHTGGVMTLYGHVSEIDVKAGDYVARGDVIGKSGATPGTRGAGWMTTGPHLHLEVFQDGKHVDPLLYLDNSVLPKK